MKLIFATNNRHKLEEVQAILGTKYTLVTPADLGIMEDIPEKADTLEANASQKAHYLHERTGENCFADDTGLEVEALGGAPGVYSARYAGANRNPRENMALLLKNLSGKSNRRARFRTVISLLLEDREYFFEGVVEGLITNEPHGEGGFGYDPVFVPDGYTVTFAEMSAEEKNRISHRGRAIAALTEFLSSYRK